MCNSDRFVLHLPGREVPPVASTQPHSEIAQFFKIEEKKAFTVEILLRGAPVETIPFNAKPDDIVELEYEGDLYRWMRVEQLRDDLQKSSSLRAAESLGENKLTIPPDFGAPPTRGGLDLLLKGLKVLGIDPVGQVAKLAVREVISKFEDSIQPARGLYMLSDPGTIERQVHDKRAWIPTDRISAELSPKSSSRFNAPFGSPVRHEARYWPPSVSTYTSRCC